MSPPDAQPADDTTGAPMRVLLVHPYFAHYRRPILRELQRSERFDYTFVGADHDPTDGTIKTLDDLPDDRYINTPWIKIAGRMVWQRGILRLTLSRKYDAVIHLGNPYHFSNWVLLLAARLTGKRSLVWSHGWRKPDTGYKRIIRNLFHKLAHGLLLYEHYAKNVGINEGVSHDDIYVVYNSLDYDKQVAVRAGITDDDVAKTRAELFPGSDRPIVILSSRLVKRRRFHIAIDAAKVLAERGHPVNLLFVGDGPEREPMQRDCAAHGLSAHFEGACYDEHRLARLFMAAAVTVSPGPIGLAVTHSLVYGRPVIASDNMGEQGPEWGTIVPGRNGDFFANDDPKALADVIQRWTPAVQVDETTAASCRRTVERAYNPAAQRRVFERALTGLPADDLMLSAPDPGTTHGAG